MIRKCNTIDFETIYAIINDAAQAYKDVIPDDRWEEPYMSRNELQHEIDDGVEFWGYEEDGQLIGVMGIQDVQDVTLIRHSYVRTARRNEGIGGRMLSELLQKTTRLTLVGTWAEAVWAIRFYEKHGFQTARDRSFWLTQQTMRLHCGFARAEPCQLGKVANAILLSRRPRLDSAFCLCRILGSRRILGTQMAPLSMASRPGRPLGCSGRIYRLDLPPHAA
jgi:N-acetylglutamate synthase-like GNAT family acetyltransferase